MNPAYYLKVGAVYLLVVVLVWAVPEALHQKAEATRYKDELTLATKSLEQARTRTASIQKQVQSANTDAAKARQSLKEVLDAEPVYRDSPTPVPVVDELCRTLRCSGAGSVSAPGR